MTRGVDVMLEYVFATWICCALVWATTSHYYRSSWEPPRALGRTPFPDPDGSSTLGRGLTVEDQEQVLAEARERDRQAREIAVARQEQVDQEGELAAKDAVIESWKKRCFEISRERDFALGEIRRLEKDR